MVPEKERDDLISAYHRRLFSGDLPLETRFARSWANWENTLASIQNDGPGGESPAEYARAFARLENHYFMNEGFLEHDGWIEANLDAIARVPGTIVQGRYDMICPPESAFRLHKAWPGSRLAFVPRAGHALSEPGISAELVRTMDTLRRTL
jgi:proline iminopeptidase